MKLIQEYSVKVIIFTFCLAILLEAIVLIFILLTSRNLLNKTYDENIQRTINKTEEFTISINTIINNLLMDSIRDLKLISRNIYIYTQQNSSIPNSLNLNSKIFSNKQTNKTIISENLTEIMKRDLFKKILNKTTNKIDYLTYYNKKFGNISDNNFILNELLRKHDELNYINFINFTQDKNIAPTEQMRKKLNFIISIFKTIYIKTYISKKEKSFLLHILFLNKGQLIIYPPEDHTNLYLYYYNYINTITHCNYSSSNPKEKYPYCIYLDAFNNTSEKNLSYIHPINEVIYYYYTYASICIKYSYVENKSDKSLICLEFDFSSEIQFMNFGKQDHFEFGLIRPFFRETDGLKEIILIYNNHNKIPLEEIFEIFNSTNETPQQFLLGNQTNRIYTFFSLYHFIYLETTKIIKEHPELNFDIKILEKEFDFIMENIKKNKNTGELFRFKFNKTTCKKELIGDEYECTTDEAEMIIKPIILNLNRINEQFLETNEEFKEFYNELYIYSIINTNPKTIKGKINTILNAKLERIIIFYFFITVIIFCFYILFINIISEYSFKSVNTIIDSMNKINIDDEKREINNLEEDKSFTANNEMLSLKEFYETMRKALIIKQVFEKELYLRKHNLEFYNLIQDLKIKQIKEISNSFIAYFHYNNKIYNLSENEFRSTINFLQEQENKLKVGGVSEFDDKLKDSIKRSSTISYLNEYSTFENLEENMLDMIYLKIFKQRFIYLYAMTKFKLGSENNSVNNAQNKKAKNNKEKKINYLNDSIKYFKECKNINSLLGINKIKIIYSLIMISKCYIQLNDYKNAITNINEALTLYFEFSQTFKDYHSKYYNPKVMLFVESNIFHYIIFTISRICITFNKQCACNWINLKIFQTSPFLFSNIHYNVGLSLYNFFDKNKTKMNKYDSNFYKNAKLMKEYEKIKKYYGKIVSRLYNKNISHKNKIINTEKIGESIYTASQTQTISESIMDKSRVSSNFKKDMATSRVSTAFGARNRKLNKFVTFCMSEKILEKLDGQEFKDVLIKFFEKYFIMNENDKFSFIQFSDNGKKTVFFKPELLNYFLLRFEKTKGVFDFTESFQIYNKSSLFVELYNILDSIIKNCPTTEDTDNIIMIFMDSEDIRFSSISDCLNIVDELNKKNCSVYYFIYNENMNDEKINNIQSFLNGLIEGYCFNIKNYQQLKQIFINISTVKSQSNFFGFDYDIFEQNI